MSLTIAGSALAAAPSASAEQPAGRLTAEQRDIGRIDARVQRYDQALGIISRLIRSPGAETECAGTCFFPSSSRSVAWRCAPNSKCELYCDVNPPVGGCR